MMMKHPNFSPHALVLLILHSLILSVFFYLSTANETSAAAFSATPNAGTPSLDQTTTQTNQEEQGNYEEALQFHDEFAKVVLTHSSGGALVDMNMEDVMGSLEVQCDDAADAEECMKRRLMTEAHLDYIYTQHHKP